MLPTSGWLPESHFQNVAPLTVALPITTPGRYLDFADGPVVFPGVVSLVARMAGAQGATIDGGANSDGDPALIVELRQLELFGVVLVDRVVAQLPVFLPCGGDPPTTDFTACGAPPASVWASCGAAPTSVWSEG